MYSPRRFRGIAGASLSSHWLRFCLPDWGFLYLTEVFLAWLRFFYLTEVFLTWLRFFLSDWGFTYLTEVFLTLIEVFLTLTEVFPCFFLCRKANARVKLAKTGHGPHSSKLVVICVVLLLFVLSYVLFVCKCVLYYCYRVSTQLQLTNISYKLRNKSLVITEHFPTICNLKGLFIYHCSRTLSFLSTLPACWYSLLSLRCLTVAPSLVYDVIVVK
jgi:hypothetical protein